MVTAPNQISCRWFRTRGGRVGADVRIAGQTYGRLAVGATLGGRAWPSGTGR